MKILNKDIFLKKHDLENDDNLDWIFAICKFHGYDENKCKISYLNGEKCLLIKHGIHLYYIFVNKEDGVLTLSSSKEVGGKTKYKYLDNTFSGMLAFDKACKFIKKRKRI